MEENASVYQVNPVSRITGEERAEFLPHLQLETRFGDKITWIQYREGFGGSKGVEAWV